MPSKLKLAFAALVAVGFAGAPALYAHDSQGSSGSMMGSGMMGQGGMMGGGMMGMMNMMSNMMSGKGQMAQGCSQMMQGMQGGHGTQRPNEQWRPKETPDKGN